MWRESLAGWKEDSMEAMRLAVKIGQWEWDHALDETGPTQVPSAVVGAVISVFIVLTRMNAEDDVNQAELRRTFRRFIKISGIDLKKADSE
jgi:hypothetical protein